LIVYYTSGNRVPTNNLRPFMP